MLHPRALDFLAGTRNYTDWTTTSVQFWGEASKGWWKVTFKNGLPKYGEVSGIGDGGSDSKYFLIKGPVKNHLHTPIFPFDNCHLDVCDLMTSVKDVLQHLPANHERELCHVQTIAYARMTIVRKIVSRK